MPHRRIFLASLMSLLVGFPGGLRAETPIYYSDGQSAINGYDTVAYFTMGRPVRGKADIAVMWKGVIWRFASLAHREAFEANPRAYAPQYGGYCAYGVSAGYRDQIEADAWQIVDGKLYLVRSPNVLGLWKRDLAGHIARGNANWPGVLNE